MNRGVRLNDMDDATNSWGPVNNGTYLEVVHMPQRLNLLFFKLDFRLRKIHYKSFFETHKAQ